MQRDKRQDILSALTLVLGCIALILVIQASLPPSAFTGRISSEDGSASAGESVAPSESSAIAIAPSSASDASPSIETSSSAETVSSSSSDGSPSTSQKKKTVTSGESGTGAATITDSSRETTTEQNTPETTAELSSGQTPTQSSESNTQHTTEIPETSSVPPTQNQIVARVSAVYDMHVSDVVEGPTIEESRIRGYRDARLFGIIPVKVPVEVEVTLESNQPTVIAVHVPWWAWAVRTD